MSPEIPTPTQSDLEYLGDGRNEKMDVWLPPASFSRPVPAVLLIHGGGWTIGDKADARERNIGSNLSASGFAVFSINYALDVRSKDISGNVTVCPAWSQNFHDCKSALRFLKKEAARFGIDAQKIAVMGGSAGGHLALLVGVTQNIPEMNAGGLYPEQSNAVACIINFYGIADVRRFGRDSFSGRTPEESEHNFDLASPIRYLGRDTPPVLVAHGTDDVIVPLQLSKDLVTELSRWGIPHVYIEIPGAPHTFDLQSSGEDLRPTVTAFLRTHLGVLQ